jgi:hypothetical protein
MMPNMGGIPVGNTIFSTFAHLLVEKDRIE